jgi:hypothetical protein
MAKRPELPDDILAPKGGANTDGQIGSAAPRTPASPAPVPRQKRASEERAQLPARVPAWFKRAVDVWRIRRDLQQDEAVQLGLLALVRLERELGSIDAVRLELAKDRARLEGDN